jgi:hypothetical protein
MIVICINPKLPSFIAHVTDAEREGVQLVSSGLALGHGLHAADSPVGRCKPVSRHSDNRQGPMSDLGLTTD